MGKWFDEEIFKRENGLKEVDNSEKELIQDWGLSANRQIDNDLSEFTDTIPYAGDPDNENDPFTRTLIDAATSWATYRRKKKMRESKDVLDAEIKNYNQIIEGAKRYLRSIPTGKTDTVVVTSDYRSDPLRWREEFFNN